MNNINSVNIYPKLKERFGEGLRPELEEVYIFQKENGVFCELIFCKESKIEKELNNLSFIYNNEDKYFDVNKGINTNVADFLMLDDYTLLLATDKMFTDEMQGEIKQGNLINYLSNEKYYNISHFEPINDSNIINKEPNSIQKPSIIKLSDILFPAEKEPLFDKDGYSEYRAVFNEITPIIEIENYDLISVSQCMITSRLYYRYIDENTIIFREIDQKMLWYEAKQQNPIAIKGNGLYACKIKNEFKDQYDLEYIYLHLRHPKFYEQFKNGITSENILTGWIPYESYDKQVEFSKRYREKIIKQVNEAKRILGI
jgi:hypothetical protein